MIAMPPETFSAPTATIRPIVLLVEDDAGVRRSLQMLLEGQGYGVRAFASAAALLADPRLSESMCLIADYRLGTEDGITMLKCLRGLGWRGAAILMTAFSSTAIAERAAGAGFAQLFEKPVKPHLVVDAIRRLVKAGT